jgi:hypothetical protein
MVNFGVCACAAPDRRLGDGIAGLDFGFKTRGELMRRQQNADRPISGG